MDTPKRPSPFPTKSQYIVKLELRSGKKGEEIYVDFFSFFVFLLICYQNKNSLSLSHAHAWTHTDWSPQEQRNLVLGREQKEKPHLDLFSVILLFYSQHNICCGFLTLAVCTNSFASSWDWSTDTTNGPLNNSITAPSIKYLDNDSIHQMKWHCDITSGSSRWSLHRRRNGLLASSPAMPLEKNFHQFFWHAVIFFLQFPSCSQLSYRKLNSPILWDTYGGSAFSLLPRVLLQHQEGHTAARRSTCAAVAAWHYASTVKVAAGMFWGQEWSEQEMNQSDWPWTLASTPKNPSHNWHISNQLQVR